MPAVQFVQTGGSEGAGLVGCDALRAGLRDLGIEATPEGVAEMIQEFDGEKDGRLIPQKLCRLLAGSIDVVALFVAKWRLNEDAQRELVALPPEALRTAIVGFRPIVAEGCDVNDKLINFARRLGRAVKGQARR